MAVIYSDQEIESLVRERKPLPSNWRTRTRLQARRGNSERHLELTGDAGGEFRLILNQNTINQFNFSIFWPFGFRSRTSYSDFAAATAGAMSTPTISKV